MTDDQGWGDVGYNGLKQVATPNLDAMAAAGIRFNRFYAAYAVCSPTRGSFLTGRHPIRFGCFLYGYPLRPQERTIAQAVQAAGYATGHFGKWHLNGVSGSGKVIAADDPLSPGKFGFDEWLSVSNFFDLNWTLSRKGTPEKFRGDGSDYIVAEALKFIAEAARQKQPFLTVIWFGNPHGPHQALPDDLEAAGNSAYHGEIRAIDRSMGRLRAGLREAGVADDTLVCVLQRQRRDRPRLDRRAARQEGEHLGRGRPRPGHHRVAGADHEALRDRRAGRHQRHLPDHRGPARPEGRQPGRAARRHQPRAAARWQDDPAPAPIGFWHHGGVKGGQEFTRETGHAAWSDNRFKLHKFASGRFELYDLAADPGEKNDLSAAQPEVVERMKAALGQWQESVLKSYRGEDYQPAKAAP